MLENKLKINLEGYNGHYYPSPNKTIVNPNFYPNWANGVKNTDQDYWDRLLSGLKQHEPQTHTEETEEAVILKVVAPESTKENFEVEIKDSMLRVTHRVKKETALSKSFEKKFLLKGTMRLGSATASYEGGVLTVEIPKVKPKQISVK